MSRKKLVRKRAGRKSQWPERLLNDMIDIITGDEYLKKKLIFTNNRNQKNSEIYESILDKMKACANERNEAVEFSCMQIRNKFKKVVSECKRAAMLMKSASGIQRFQEERGYGKWFNQLFALVKTRDSCQPDQAIEPFASHHTSPCASSSTGTTSDSQEFFVPVQAKRRKTKKESQFDEWRVMMKSIADRNPMSEFINFAKEEAEKSREHEMKLIQLLLQSEAKPQQQQQFYHNNPQAQPQQQQLYHHLPQDMCYNIVNQTQNENVNSTSYYDF